MLNSRTKLYGALSKDFDLGTIEEFNSKMDNPDSRKKLYDSVSKEFDLGDFTEFESKVSPLKKKESSESTSTTIPEGSASAQSSGSSAIPDSKFGEGIKTIYDTPKKKIEARDNPNSQQAYQDILKRDKLAKNDPNYGKKLADRTVPLIPEKIIDKDDELRNQAVRKIQPLADRALTITDEDNASIEQDYNEELTNSGFKNNVKQVFGGIVNKVSETLANSVHIPISSKPINTDNPLKEYEEKAVKEALQAGKTLSATEKQQRAKELFIDNRKSEIIQSRLNDVNHEMSKEEQFFVKQDRYDKLDNLNRESKSLLKNIPIISASRDNTISDLEETYNHIADLHKNNQPIPQELIEQFQTLQNRGNRFNSELANVYQKYNSNKKDIGTFEQEYDVYKTENNRYLNGLGRLGNALLGIEAGALGAADYVAAGMDGTGLKPENSKLHQHINKIHKDIEERNQYLQHTSKVEDISDFVDKTLDFTADNIPMVTALTLTGGAGIAGLATTAAGDKYTEMVNEDLDPNNPNPAYSKAQKIAAPALYGATMIAPMATQLNTIRNGARALEAIATESPELLKKSLLKKSQEMLFKEASASFKLANELKGMEFLQEGVNHFVLGKDVDYKKLADLGVYETAPLLHAMNKAAPHILMAATKPFMNAKEVAELDNNSKQLFELYGKLNDQKLDSAEKAIVQETIDGISKASRDLVKSKIGDISKMPKPLVDELLKATEKSSQLREKAVRINSADEGKFTPEQKKVILADLKEQYRQNESHRVDILTGTKNVVDVLPLGEQDKLKRQALKELTAEQNPDGKKNLTIDNKEITERALKIYHKQVEKSKVTEQESAKEESAEPVQESVEVEKLETEKSNEGKATDAPVVDGEARPSADSEKPLRQDNELQSANDTSYDKGETDPLKNNEKITFYTGRKSKVDDFSKTKGEHIFFSKNKDVSKWYGGDEANVTEAKLDTSKFADLSTQEKKAEFVRDNFTDKDISEMYPELYRRALDNRDVRKSTEQKHKELIDEYRNRLQENRFSGDGKEQNFLLKKLKEKGFSGVALRDSFFGKEDVSYVVLDKSAIKDKKIEHALSEIDKGVLNWSGDVGTERVNLGIDWRDIRKGEKDLKAGKENTVPAKRLVEALQKAKEKGGYEYVQGSGGVKHSQFVSFEDMQRNSNEHGLSDAELNEYNTKQSDLAKEHETHFNLLSEPEQLKILENYENNTGKVRTDTEQRQGDNDAQSKESQEVKSSEIGESATSERNESERPAETSSGTPEKQEVERPLRVKDLGEKAREYAKEVREKGVLPDWLKADLPKGTKVNGIDINEAFAKALETFADIHDATKDFKKAVEEGFKHIKDWYDENKIEYDESDLKEKFANHVEVPQRTTSIKNAVTKAERELQGKSEVEVLAKRGFGKVFDTAKEMVESGEVDPRLLAEQISKKPRPLSAEEGAVLLYDRMRIQNEHQTVVKALAEALKSGDVENQSALLIRRNNLEEAANNNDVADKLGGYENSLALSARRLIIKEDFSLARLTSRMKAADAKGEVSESERKQITDLHERLLDAESRLEKYESEKKSKKETDEFTKIKKEVKRESRTYNKSKLKVERDNIVSNIRKKLADARSGKSGLTAVPVPYAKELAAITPDLIALAKNLVKDGVITLDEVIDNIHDEMQDFLEGITKRDIRDAISGYGKVSQMSKDEVNIQLREIKRQGKLVSSLEDAMGLNGEAPKRPARSGLQRDQPSQTVRDLQKKVEKALKENGLEIEKNIQDPEEAWKSALDKYKKRLANKKEDLQEKFDNGDFTKVKRKPLQLDWEATKLKSDVKKIQNEIEAVIRDKERKEQPKIFKALDWYAKYNRGLLITSIFTNAKLFGAAFWRPVQHLPEEIISFGLQKIPAFKRLGEGAPNERISSNEEFANSMASYYSTYVKKQTYKDAWESFKRGESNEELAFGNERPREMPRDYIMKVLDMIGRSHGATKYPAFKSKFESALQKNAAYEIARGNDPSDPMVDQVIKNRALVEGLRDKFSQDNTVVKMQRMMEAMLDNKAGNKEKHFSSRLTSKVAGTMLRTALPITKIASNYGAEASSLMFGGVKASPVIVEWMKNGIESLKPEDKDYILRNLKKQGVGVGLYLLGYLAYQNVAAFHKSLKKEEDEKLKHGEALGVPKILTHNPMWEVIKAGATYRHVKEEYNKEMEQRGGIEGAYEATVGVVKENPYVNTITHSGESLKGTEGVKKAVAETVATGLIPPDLKRLAERLDPTYDTDVKRKPKTIWETIEMGIPHFREQVKTDLEIQMEKRANPEKKTAKERHENKVEDREKEKNLKKLSEELGVKYVRRRSD